MLNEIRWHGRGGQGAKTVSQLLAMALMDYGFYVQAFPEYGPERSGAPMQAYTRSSDRPIRLHCGVTNPDIIVVLDASLLGEIDVLHGLVKEGIALINSREEVPVVRNKIGFDGPLYCVDADRLASESGIDYANVVMVGAIASAMEIPPLESVKRAAKQLLRKKLPPDILNRNLAAIEAGYKNCQQESNEEASWLVN